MKNYIYFIFPLIFIGIYQNKNLRWLFILGTVIQIYSFLLFNPVFIVNITNYIIGEDKSIINKILSICFCCCCSCFKYPFKYLIIIITIFLINGFFAVLGYELFRYMDITIMLILFCIEINRYILFLSSNYYFKELNDLIHFFLNYTFIFSVYLIAYFDFKLSTDKAIYSTEITGDTMQNILAGSLILAMTIKKNDFNGTIINHLFNMIEIYLKIFQINNINNYNQISSIVKFISFIIICIKRNIHLQTFWFYFYIVIYILLNVKQEIRLQIGIFAIMFIIYLKLLNYFFEIFSNCYKGIIIIQKRIRFINGFINLWKIWDLKRKEILLKSHKLLNLICDLLFIIIQTITLNLTFIKKCYST